MIAHILFFIGGLWIGVAIGFGWTLWILVTRSDK